MRVLLFLFFFLFGSFLFSKESVKKQVQIDLYTSVPVKKASPQTEAAVFSDKNFVYQQSVKPSQNGIELFLQWLTDMLGKSFFKTPENSYTAVKFLFIGFFVAGVFFVLYQSNFRKMFYLKSKNITNNSFSDMPEDLNTIDILWLIQKAFNEKDYRLAMRWYFLYALQTLSSAQKIVWVPSKTNSEYQNELQNQELKKEFHQLTHTFEHVWYGGHLTTENTYMDYKNKTERFISYVKKN
ncbi:MAG: DUF4129 domain-containing protein [Bacteroidetes bacterium]|nr:DUF4129 domain-containing protein [Bacteroidota bacterium]